MTIKIQDILAAKPVLDKLMHSNFSGKKAFTIARMMKKIQAEMELYEESRTNLIQKYAERDEQGELKVDEQGMIHVAPEQIFDCNAELIELAMAEINLDCAAIPYEWLEEVEMTPEEAISIEAFIEE